MVAAVDEAIVDLLDGSFSLVKGTNLFMGKMRDGLVDGTVVTVLSTGGDVPIGFLQGQSEKGMFNHSVQIAIRSGRRVFGTGQTLANNVYDTVNFATIATYIEVRCDQSAPLYFQENNDGDHFWTINAKLMYIA